MIIVTPDNRPPPQIFRLMEHSQNSTALHVRRWGGNPRNAPLSNPSQVTSASLACHCGTPRHRPKSPSIPRSSPSLRVARLHQRFQRPTFHFSWFYPAHGHPTAVASQRVSSAVAFRSTCPSQQRLSRSLHFLGQPVGPLVEPC